jgi:hypothetical protein
VVGVPSRGSLEDEEETVRSGLFHFLFPHLGTHTTHETGEATPMPPAPAESNCIRLPKDNLSASPTYTDTPHPFPAFSANGSQPSADCKTWQREGVSAPGASEVVSRRGA